MWFNYSYCLSKFSVLFRVVLAMHLIPFPKHQRWYQGLKSTWAVTCPCSCIPTGSVSASSARTVLKFAFSWSLYKYPKKQACPSPSLFVPWTLHCFGNVETAICPAFGPLHAFVIKAEELLTPCRCLVHRWGAAHMSLLAFSPINWTNKLYRPDWYSEACSLVLEHYVIVLLWPLSWEFPKPFLTGDSRTGRNVLNVFSHQGYCNRGSMTFLLLLGTFLCIQT